jgi:hypothetical protein
MVESMTETSDYLELLRQERDDYRQMLTLSLRMSDWIRSEDSEELLRLLGEQKAIKDRIDQRQRGLRALREDIASGKGGLREEERRLSESHMEEIRSLLEQLVELQQQGVAGLQQQQRDAVDRIRQIDQARQAGRLYRKQMGRKS